MSSPQQRAKLKAAIGGLAGTIDEAGDLRGLDVTFDAIAAAVVDAGLVSIRGTKAAPALKTILTRLVKKGRIVATAVASADGLMSTFRRAHYFDDLHDDDVERAEEQRQDLYAALRSLLRRGRRGNDDNHA